MGYFAVLRRPESAAPEFRVEWLHVNWWTLPLLLGRYGHYVDIGLVLGLPGGGRRAEFELVLPFDTGPDEPVDLAPAMLRHDVASLIFGQPVSIHLGRRLTSPVGELVVMPLASDTRPVDRTAAYSRWSVAVQEVPEAPPEGPFLAYVRLRFRPRRRPRPWSWEWSGLHRDVGLLDLRVLDARETSAIPDGVDIRARALAVGRMAIFTIVPSRMRLRTISPDPHYVRLLEGAVWEPYLRRAATVSGRGAFHVVQWRAPREPGVDQVDVDHPFRGLLSLEPGPVLPVGHVLGVLLLLAAGLVTLLGPSAITEGPAWAALTGLADLVRRQIVPAIASLVVAVGVGAVYSVSKDARRLFWRLHRGLRHAEEWFFRLLRRSH